MSAIGRELASEIIAALRADPELRQKLADVLSDVTDPHEGQQPRFLTIPQAAARYGCTPAAMRKRADRGLVTKHFQGSRIYIDSLEVDHGLIEGAE
jgi:hypothetical protein